MCNKTIEQFSTFCEKELDLHRKLVVENRTDPNESFYKSLPICIIDAVFSIGVNYQSVEKATNTFLDYFGLEISREFPIKDEYTINRFISDMGTFESFEEAAKKGFNNMQRTSSVNGILKAEACYRVAEVFKKHGINTLSDFNTYTNKAELDSDILKVKGQGSGIMLKYLYMLAGNTNEVKPDRHLVNFMKTIFPQLSMDSKDHKEIKMIMEETVLQLKTKYPQLTERFLDVLIWEHMR